MKDRNGRARASAVIWDSIGRQVPRSTRPSAAADGQVHVRVAKPRCSGRKYCIGHDRKIENFRRNARGITPPGLCGAATMLVSRAAVRMVMIMVMIMRVTIMMRGAVFAIA
jgi:hypothetical protein